MKDKIYKLNRPKGFYFMKRALIAATSIFIGSVVVAVPLSIAMYNKNNAPVEQKDAEKIEKQSDTLDSETKEELLTIK